MKKIFPQSIEVFGDIVVSLVLGAVMWNASGIWQWGLTTALSVFLLIDWLRRS